MAGSGSGPSQIQGGLLVPLDRSLRALEGVEPLPGLQSTEWAMDNGPERKKME